MLSNEERTLRQAIIDGCVEMNAAGYNQGMSGNVSARFGDCILITPGSIAYDRLRAEMIVPLAIADGRWSGEYEPSSEWRFHRDIIAARSDVNAVVHLHSPFATALSMARKPIPACHYLIASFGGDDVRCADYAVNGSQDLSDVAVAALEGRTACLLANHGMITVGETLEAAFASAVQLETLARQYCIAMSIGGPVLLTRQEVEASPAYRNQQIPPVGGGRDTDTPPLAMTNFPEPAKHHD
ncbi:class II aldolase/adducin family protein [Hoeflea sp.]|uniref:class II aldolase/adducin family protein n=1 Tax=Hoeflea sp. TaxID=1940281 RepID=UPI003B01B590